MSENVFCCNCKWFKIFSIDKKSSETFDVVTRECVHDACFKKEMKPDRIDRIRILTHKELNHDNCCSHFKPTIFRRVEKIFNMEGG